MTIRRRDIQASWKENLALLHTNNKGADQLAHPRSLISPFVIRSFERIKTELATFSISILYLVSVAEQAGLKC